MCALAATVFISAYDEVGSFFDLVRADGMLIALLGWALVAIRCGALRSGALLLCAAFLCKHNAAIFGLPCVWWLLKEHNWAAAVRFAVWSAVPALAMTIALQLSTEGYFLTYLLGVGGHPIVAYRLIWWTARELMEVAPALVGCGLLWLLWQLYSQRQKLSLVVLSISIGLSLTALWIESSPHHALWGSRHNAVLPYVIPMWIGAAFSLRKLVCFRGGNGFWLLNGLVAIAFSALMRGHHGGFINVLIPGVWALSVAWVVVSAAMEE